MKRIVLAGLLVLALVPAAIEAQQRQPPASPIWTVGVRGGADMNFNEEMFGLTTRIPSFIVPKLSFQGSLDWTFLPFVTEWQMATDVVYDMNGIGLAAGPVFRNSRWADAPDRETRVGWSVAAIVGGVPLGRLPVALALELRYVRVEGFTPTPLTIGLNVAPGRLF